MLTCPPQIRLAPSFKGNAFAANPVMDDGYRSVPIEDRMGTYHSIGRSSAGADERLEDRLLLEIKEQITQLELKVDTLLVG